MDGCSKLVESARSMRVLLAGGGSGGSATPVLAVAEVLRRRSPSVELLYIGTAGGPERALVDAAGIPFLSVPAGKLRRYVSLENFTDVAHVVAGLLASLQAVRRFRPDVAFGAGGFASVPPLWAARLLGVPVHIHQQDVIPGLANRLLVPAARSISVTFEQTLPRFPRARSVLRGNPVRQSVLEGVPSRFFTAFGFDSTVPTVLFTGGGTGALRLNQIAARAANDLARSAQILHLTGQGREVPVEHMSPRYKQQAFLTEAMPDALRAATVIVTRAGLGTLSEISALGLPAVVVPMPRSHQEANAAAFERAGAAVVLHEEALTPEILARTVNELINDPRRRAAHGEAARALLPLDAAERVADDVLRIAKR